jgi:hypothetical protein
MKVFINKHLDPLKQLIVNSCSVVDYKIICGSQEIVAKHSKHAHVRVHFHMKIVYSANRRRLISGRTFFEFVLFSPRY